MKGTNQLLKLVQVHRKQPIYINLGVHLFVWGAFFRNDPKPETLNPKPSGVAVALRKMKQTLQCEDRFDYTMIQPFPHSNSMQKHNRSIETCPLLAWNSFLF